MAKLDWLETAVFYNIYPQSFYDTNGDGIGDLNGIIEKLDYVKEMGFNAIWINPFYVSPFKDAGYDVTDFYTVAPRYGTNGDFIRLCRKAKEKGIKIIVDLVAGHTSLECEWFKKSALPEKNEYTNRYIWTDSTWNKGKDGLFISGYSDRDGCYMSNFFYCQPALNYGFANVEEEWQLPVDHPDCVATKKELINIMEYWIGLGADGFRVDMASSLIKNDPDHSAVMKFWQEIRELFDKKYPDCVLISEWSYPKKAINGGFHIDFMIQFNVKCYTTLFRYEKGTNQHNDWIGHSFFRKEGKGNFNEFLEEYMDHYNATVGKGYIAIPTGNHDIPRISLGRDFDDLKVAYAFILTMPGVPFVYYGDEIGMRYIENLPSKEGGYNRTGARTPMQWGSGKNLGFSESDTPYLPVDDREDAPTVEKQLKDPDSLLNFVKELIKIRKAHPALCASGGFKVINSGYPLLYERFTDEEKIRVLINPSERNYEIDEILCDKIILSKNAQIRDNKIHIGGRGCMIYSVRT